MIKNREDEGDVLGKIDNTATVNDISDIPTEDTFWKRLLGKSVFVNIEERVV